MHGRANPGPQEQTSRRGLLPLGVLQLLTCETQTPSSPIEMASSVVGAAPVDEAARFKVLHVLKEAGPRVGVIAVQALLGGQLQHAQPKCKDVNAARVLVLQVVLRQYSCAAASVSISHRWHMAEV